MPTEYVQRLATTAYITFTFFILNVHVPGFIAVYKGYVYGVLQARVVNSF